MKRSILIGICALLGVATSMAQTYVVEGLYRDQAKASENDPGASLMSRLDISAAFGDTEKEIMLPNGTEVQLLSDQARRMVKVQYEGETWWMDARELRFAESNPPGTVDVLAGLDFSPAPMEMHLADDTVAYANTMERGTAEWAFLHSLVPPVLILLLVAALAVLLWRAAPDEFHAGMTPLRRLALWLAPVLMLAVAALEAWYLLRMGGESYWWCSLYYYSKWGTALRWVPYALVVIAQWYAFAHFYMLLNNVVRKTTVTGRIWMVGLTVAAVAVGCVLAFVLHPDWAESQTLDEAVAWTRSWALYAVVLGLVFPIIYMCVKLRNPLLGVLAGAAAWAFMVVSVWLSVLFLAASWTMLKAILIPLLAIVMVVVFTMFLSRFKTVKTGTRRVTTRTVDDDGHVVSESTTYHDVTHTEFK